MASPYKSLLILGKHFFGYSKIPKINPGAYIFQRPLLRGLFSEGLIYGGKLAFQNRLGQPYSWTKFTFFTLFYFVFEGKFPGTSPRGTYIWRDDLTEDFLCYRLGGLIFGGACTWRGLFYKFYGITYTKCYSDRVLARVFVYLPPFICQILDFIY